MNGINRRPGQPSCEILMRVGTYDEPLRARATADVAEVVALPTTLATSVELMRTAYHRQVFPRHTHDYLTVGLIQVGNGVIWYRGREWKTRVGDIVVIPPGEVHTGAVGRNANGEGLSYMALHVPPLAVIAAAEAEGPHGSSLPDFADLVVGDPRIAQQLHRINAFARRTRGASVQTTGGAATVRRDDEPAADEALTVALALLVRHHVAARPAPATAVHRGADSRVVRLAREIIHDCYADNSETSLRALAERVGVSPFHLVREFTHAVGLSPHRYLVQTRVRRAGELLARGAAPSFVAAETGFVDQSHLTMQFKRYVGVTPASYRRAYA